MILALAMLMLAPPCITTGPHSFQCDTPEQCLGIGDGTSMQTLCISPKLPKWHPQETGMGHCAMDQHLHSKDMDTNAPDVRGADEPIPDNLCHKDSDDSAVLPRRKLSK